MALIIFFLLVNSFKKPIKLLHSLRAFVDKHKKEQQESNQSYSHNDHFSHVIII